jgi:hypothetical protein
MAKGDKQDVARAKAAVSKKKVRGGQAQAFPRPRGGVQKGSKDAWSRPGRTYKIYDDDTNKQTQPRSSKITSTGKPRADSKALIRAKAIRSGMSKAEIANQRISEMLSDQRKASAKLNGNKTPKQLKDDRVKAARQKSSLAKIKANPKIGLSPTSSALERAKAKRGNK